MRHIVILILVLAALAGCEPITPDQAARNKLYNPMRNTTVEHDDARGVTCWKWSEGGGAGAASGLSCLPDWMLRGQTQARNERQLSPHEQQPEPIPAVMQGGIDVERWIL